MKKAEFIKKFSKIEDTFEDEFRAEFNSPELIWEAIRKPLNIPDVSQQRELLLAFEEYCCKLECFTPNYEVLGENINDFLANNYTHCCTELRDKETPTSKDAFIAGYKKRAEMSGLKYDEVSELHAKTLYKCWKSFKITIYENKNN